MKLGGRTRPKLFTVPGGAGCSPHYFPCVLLFRVHSVNITFLLTVEERSMDPQQCVCVAWGLQTNLNNFLDDLLAVAVFAICQCLSYISVQFYFCSSSQQSDDVPCITNRPNCNSGWFLYQSHSAVELLFFTGFIKFIKGFEWILMKLRGVRLLWFYKFTIYW